MQKKLLLEYICAICSIIIDILKFNILSVHVLFYKVNTVVPLLQGHCTERPTCLVWPQFVCINYHIVIYIHKVASLMWLHPVMWPKMLHKMVGLLVQGQLY